MNILRVISTLDPEHGGPIEGLRQSTEVLSRWGHYSEVVTVDPPDSPWLSDFACQVHGLGRVSDIYWFAPHLVRWLRQNAPRFDVVIQHGLWNYTAFATQRALRGASTPYFVFTHGMLDPWFQHTYPVKRIAKQFLWWMSEGRLLSGAQAVFFTSQEERLRARGQFWPYRVREEVVAYGTGDVTGNVAEEIAAFRGQLPQLGTRPYLLFLSRIHPKKGCDFLIRAFADIAQRDGELDLVIAGPDLVGWKKELERLAVGLGVGSRVHWPGMLKGSAKWGAYRGCTAFVLPSHQENFGIVVAEAMACGRPVLTTDKVNIWREVEAGGGGVVAPDTQQGVATLLGTFLDRRGEWQAMGEAARRTFLEHFEINAVANDLLRALSRE